MSLHQDKDEQDFAAPIVSVSLGLPAIFLFGGLKRSDKPARFRLVHGDVVVWGGPSRLFFHGVAPLADGEHAAAGPPAHQPDFSKSALTQRLTVLSIEVSYGLCSPAGRGANIMTHHLRRRADSGAGASRTGIYLAVLQLMFTLGWTTYVIYLPKLAARSGSRLGMVIFILMLDQAIFTITDTAMGIAADKIAPFVGRLGVFVGILTAISCAAFVALPFVAGTGPGAQVWFIVLIVIWVMTSSALRAPPLTLARQASRAVADAVPVGAGDAGLRPGRRGVALSRRGAAQRRSAAAVPHLGRGAAAHDAGAVEGRAGGIAAQAPAPSEPAVPPKRSAPMPMFFIASMVILSLGYQLHFSLNSASFFLRFTTPDQLQWLMPVFWIGFNIAMFPASVVVKHRGGLIVMGAAGLLGALAVLAAELSGSLNILIVAQFVAGAAWGCMLMSAVSAALAIGETGAEGKVVGLVFSALALATFARMAAVAGGLQKLPEYAPLLHWAPVACWAVAGAGLLAIAASRVQRSMQERQI